MHENASWERSTFATLTYDDEHLPSDMSLDKNEFTNFWKRLRKTVGNDRRIRYYGCGEYGEIYKRPHYHAIIFGIGAYEKGLVEKAWQHGFVYLGTVTKASARYCADYVGKAVSPRHGPTKRYREAYEILTGKAYQGRQIPFAVMSQGLGRAYVDEHGPLFLSNGVTVEGKRVPVPRYYWKRLTAEKQVLPDLWVSNQFKEIELTKEEQHNLNMLEFQKEQIEKNLVAKAGIRKKGFL